MEKFEQNQKKIGAIMVSISHLIYADTVVTSDLGKVIIDHSDAKPVLVSDFNEYSL